MSRVPTRIISSALFIIFALQVVTSMLAQSATCDEVAHHIPAGYSYYKKWDFRLNPSNPPLSRYLVAFPLNFLKLKAPFGEQCWEQADTPAFGRKFLYEYNRDKARLIIFLSRLPMLLIGLLLAFLVYRTAYSYYGGKAGLFALFLFAFSPEILAHSGLATTDITAACFIFLAIYAFRSFTKKPSLLRALAAGSTLGLAQLSKYSAVILYPAFFLLAIYEFTRSSQRNRALLGKVIFISLFSVVTIWAGYGFRLKPFLKEASRPEEKIAFVKDMGRRLTPFWSRDISEKTERILNNTPLPLTTYITGFFGFLKHAKDGHLIFFRGRWSGHGNPLYYLIAFLIKTPLPVILFFLAAILSLRRKKFNRDELYLVIPMFFIFLSASLNKLQLGIRYILPFYPLAFVFFSRFIPTLQNRRLQSADGVGRDSALQGPKEIVNPRVWARAGSIDGIHSRVQRFIFGLLLVWLVAINIFIRPHYLSYFNELIGGPDNGWRYLRDSNIDWGQDLPALAGYLKRNKINEVALEYFGQDDPGIYGINFRKFREEEYGEPGDSVYAVSAHYLEHAKWPKDYKPTAKAGYSIFIYDFRKAKNG